MKTKNLLHLGIDIGSTSVNTVIINSEQEIIENRYDYCYGKPFHVLKGVLDEIFNKINPDQIGTISLTGSGGKRASELIGGNFVNEIIAHSTSIAKLYPQVKTIIEMGGEDSKLIFMESDGYASHSQLTDFAMNSLCAAGTGSFLDQQANRIGVSIENEFGDLSLKSKNPPRIAGRCSVFAKSDMIHLQQIATPLHDIVAGLCFAVARNFKSTLGRGKKFKAPFIFQGGVAANSGMVRAFREVFDLKEGELIVPEHHASMGAIGAVFHTLSHPDTGNGAYTGTEKLDEYLKSTIVPSTPLGKLVESKAVYNKEVKAIPSDVSKLQVSLGLDIGSLSTNLVLIDAQNNVIARRYLPTASKPLNAIQRGLKEINEEVGERIEVIAVGTTGSGRYLTGDFVGADVVRNEITAQATAAISYDPTVDTIFEIGGQDSKYIRIENGVIVDFEMNKVCAAGTGSFIEEQSEKLNINIIKEFGNMALESDYPSKLGDRCTVFMESDLNSLQQKGASINDLVGGLAYSIVQNYIQKVVGTKPIGNKIFFQGGVTNNRAVVAAFEKITGKPVIIPPHFDVTGAIGAAILARENKPTDSPSKFKGFKTSDLPFAIDSFSCKECSNDCEIQRVKIDGQKKSLFYGGRCEKYEVEERKSKSGDIPNYFEERIKYLTGDYFEEPKDERITIGIPRSLAIYYQQFPFWRTFFKQLGFRLVISDLSDHKIVKKSLELMVAETCFPVEIVHGHVNNLIEKDVDYIFVPFIVNARAQDENPTANCNCPWVQTYPFMLKSAFTDEKIREKLLIPALHFRHFDRALVKELQEFMLTKFDITKKKTALAIKFADIEQITFENTLQKRGLDILSALPEDKIPLVILGRPYNTGDPFLNLRLVEKLIHLNTIPIPVDFLPLQQENIFDDYKMMYWPNGQKILSATRIINKHPRLFGVYLGNFRCGPDSFLTHYVREEMGGKPYLHLEVDEHSADAGMVTRLEAFLDSLSGYLKMKPENSIPENNGKGKVLNHDGRKLYIPYARDTVHAVAAAARFCGIEAEVLPMPDEKDLEIARKHINGQECFPFVATAGSFIRKIQEPGTDPSKIMFFMPDHNGPCRFGDYRKLHRILFDRLGYHDVAILSPTNDTSYAEMAPGKSGKFRINAWKGIVALDMLKKLLQERRPYEKVKGQTTDLYNFWLQKVVESIETGSKEIAKILNQAGKEFEKIPLEKDTRRPVIAILGETFMRDNPFCSGFVVDKLEALGAETVMAPFAEWLEYSTYRYKRDSKWKGDFKGVLQSHVQQFAQHYTGNKLRKSVSNFVEMDREISVDQMLKRSAPYVHKDYDGEPVVALGAASGLFDTKISGVIYIMPFTCMPGTLVASVTNDFRKDHKNIPWETIAYDGQQDNAIETRLQAFMYQAMEFKKLHGF